MISPMRHGRSTNRAQVLSETGAKRFPFLARLATRQPTVRLDVLSMAFGRGLLFSADLEPGANFFAKLPVSDQDHVLSGPLRPRAPLKTELGSHRPPGRGEKIL